MLSYAQLFVTPWTAVPPIPGSSVYGILQARIPSGLPFPPPKDCPDPGIEPELPVSPELAGGFFTTESPGKPPRPLEGLIANLDP